MIEPVRDDKSLTRIGVFGIGGAGCNAINHMIDAGLSGVELYAVNTDLQALAMSMAPNKLQIGAQLTGGLGSGGDPKIGKQAADESIELLRDAHQQFDDPRAIRVPKRRLRPGDLVFFGPGKGPVRHVGIYAGRGRFLNATTHGVPEVRVDSLYDRHWAPLYRGARRYR